MSRWGFFEPVWTHTRHTHVFFIEFPSVIPRLLTINPITDPSIVGVHNTSHSEKCLWGLLSNLIYNTLVTQEQVTNNPLASHTEISYIYIYSYVPHSQRRCDTVAPRLDFQKLRGKDMWPTQSHDANDLGRIVGWYWGKKCDESIWKQSWAWWANIGACTF